MHKHRLAMIIGQYKSGSTWLLNLLSRHPDIRGVAETSVFGLCDRFEDPIERTKHLFQGHSWAASQWRSRLTYQIASQFGPLVSRRPRLHLSERPAVSLDMPRRLRRKLKSKLINASTNTEYCRTLFDALGAWAQPPVYLLEKSPRHIRYTPEIREAFPDAKLLAVHRDGRDVVVSARYFEPMIGCTHSFEEAVLIWKRNIEREKKYAREYDIHVLSYESLLSDGANVLTRILEFLELPRGPETVNRMLDRSSFQFMTGRRPGEARPNQMFRKGVAGDWANQLTSEQAEHFSRIAGDTLVELGYARDPDWRTWTRSADAI